jgi:hypothetical protein
MSRSVFGRTEALSGRRYQRGLVGVTMSLSSLMRVSPLRRRRLLAVTYAMLIALTIWSLAELVFGLDIRTPALGGIPEPTPIGGFEVLVVSGSLSVAAWALLALLERLTIRARKLWAVIAIVALMLSLATPLSGTGITAANRLVLLLIHVSVGAVLIPTLYWSSRRPQ